MKLISFLMIILAITGCSSEVDKCVDAQVKGWEAEKKRAETTDKKGLTLADALGLIRVEEDKRTKAEFEADARFRCLRISSKN